MGQHPCPAWVSNPSMQDTYGCPLLARKQSWGTEGCVRCARPCRAQGVQVVLGIVQEDVKGRGRRGLL